MLRQRVLTAIVLLAIILPAIFILDPIAWALLTLAFLAVGAWEWARLLPGAPRPMLAGASLLFAGLAALVLRDAVGWPEPALIALALAVSAFWVFLGPGRLAGHEARRGGWPLAALLLFACWVALYELRVLGAIALLSSMAVIWVADIAAYFCGKAFGRRKLAPSISPGKSWEGAIGGLLAVALLGVAASIPSALSGSLPAVLAQRFGLLPMVLALEALAALSIVGDLHESLLKREAGVKDSGWILPGHGGVLDRIDALIPTMPLALALYLLVR